MGFFSPQVWKHILFAILFTGGAFTVAAYFENKVAIWFTKYS